MPSKYDSFLSHVGKNVILKFIFPCRMSFCSTFHDPDYTHTILNFTIQPPTGEAWTKTENCSTFQVCCVPPRMDAIRDYFNTLTLYLSSSLWHQAIQKNIQGGDNTYSVVNDPKQRMGKKKTTTKNTADSGSRFICASKATVNWLFLASWHIYS